MSGWLEQTAGRRAEGAPPAAQPPRRSAASYALAGTIAVVSCLFLLFVVFVLMAGRVTGLYFQLGYVSGLALMIGVFIAIAGLVVAAVVAVLAARGGSQAAPASTISGPAAEASSHARRRVVLLGVAAAIAAGAILLFLMFDALSLGYGVLGKLVLLGAAAVAAAGIVGAVVAVIAALLPGRSTSLRTRTFGVIVAVVLIPSLCLAAFGAWAYYKSWETATSLSVDQARYQAGELATEVRSVQSQHKRFTPEQRAVLANAIAEMYGVRGHQEGAQLATLDQIRQTSTLPIWAIASLEKTGWAIGSDAGPRPLQNADIVAWRVGPETVRYFVPVWSGNTNSPPVPVTTLFWIGVLGVALIVVLGLIGAWVLSRSVVRPVRRLAAASGRLAEGEAGVTVRPEGPRELRELALAFNDMNAKLSKAQETEQAFLLSVSHELKTPLTSIRGYAEGIDDGTLKAEEGAVVIGAESRRLERLVGDLLESGRMRKSAFTVRREPVDLTAVAEDVARRYEEPARDAGLTLLLTTEAGGRATADHDRVLQVVSNLVENAIRCTPAPGSVTIATAPGSITVSDTGRGLTSDDLPRAFERFYLYSRYGTDRPVGTGLGLAIVKELSEAMGGSVSVSSAVGVGTAFTVVLPAPEAEPAAEHTRPEPPPAAPQPPAAESETAQLSSAEADTAASPPAEADTAALPAADTETAALPAEDDVE